MVLNKKTLRTVYLQKYHLKDDCIPFPQLLSSNSHQ